MEIQKTSKQIGLVGGGPAAMFMYKRFVESGQEDLKVTIFEKQEKVGVGMPYSSLGACNEHITNVSGNEIPAVAAPLKDWMNNAPGDLLRSHNIDRDGFNDYKVLPRLLFGKFLNDQFKFLLQKARQSGITSEILCNTHVTDIEDEPDRERVKVTTAANECYYFDTIVICTGHTWPQKHEGKTPDWFDSPYPPAKLDQKVNYPVAIKGSSLTAIDAVRTLARKNGTFTQNEDNALHYTLNSESSDLRLVLHSLGGLLPAVRFHLEDTHLDPDSPISDEEVVDIKAKNNGFLPLDYLFERNFKQPLQKHDPEFYEKIKGMGMEEFVAHMMEKRERTDPFLLLKAEYAEAEKSIRRHESVSWKEMLATLSYAMNYPAKHLSAEDMLRMKKILMPLISVVIAFVPQSSCREMLALHEAGVLSIISVDKDSEVKPADEGGALYCYTDDDGQVQQKYYSMFIDAVGQPPVMYQDIPFNGLKEKGTISAASLKFNSAADAKNEIGKGNDLVIHDGNENYYLKVPGISINDDFQVLDVYGKYNNRIYIMAVPFIAGLNPDYSGLDFCETASETIAKAIFKSAETPAPVA